MTEVPSLSTVTLGGTTWYAIHPTRPGEPHSSLTQLVQGVWEAEPDRARLILRRRILTSDLLTPMNWGMVKTAAQRVTSVTSASLEGPPADAIRVSFSPDSALPPLEAAEETLPPMELAHSLATRARREGELYTRDRPVGCVLVGPAGERLAWARNDNARNRTRHAEVNLLQALFARTRTGPPPGSTLFTTLEPCRMCAGMLHDVAADLRVRYAVPDHVPPVPWRLDVAPHSSH